jgi:transposase-like protein
LPETEGDRKKRSKFKSYPIGYFHIDIAEVRTEEGKIDLLVAIDRTSKFVYVELLENFGKLQAAEFLRNLIKKVPYKIHTILTDNSIQFTNRSKDKNAFMHIFYRVCNENKIEHRLTKVNHPWTNGQVERMNRTLKEATVQRYYYENHERLREHLHTFVNAYHFAKKLKTLKGLTPYEFIIKSWQLEPNLFMINPHHFIKGLYNYEQNS